METILEVILVCATCVGLNLIRIYNFQTDSLYLPPNLLEHVEHSHWIMLTGAEVQGP